MKVSWRRWKRVSAPDAFRQEREELRLMRRNVEGMQEQLRVIRTRVLGDGDGAAAAAAAAGADSGADAVPAFSSGLTRRAHTEAKANKD